MATPYYTDDMRDFVRNLPNDHKFPVTISQLEDANGPFLILTIEERDYRDRYNGGSIEEFQQIARYLVDLRDGLMLLGARATFAVQEAKDEEV